MTEAPLWQKAAVLVLREFDWSKLPRRERAAFKRGEARAPYPHVIECGIDDGAGAPRVDARVYTLSDFWLTRLGHPAGVAREAEVRYAFFADEACTQLVCRTLAVPPDDSGVRTYDVVDPVGQVVGSIDRVPGRNRFVRHTWRLRQPGRPELAAGKVTRRVVRDGVITGALELAAGLVTDLLFGKDNGGDSGGGQGPRTLEWWTTGAEPAQKALTSSTGCVPGQPWRVWADWLDRRLVFTQMLLRDF